MTQFNPHDDGSVRLPNVQANLAALAHEVKVVPHVATLNEDVVFRMKPDRRRVQGTVLPYRERRAFRR